MLSEEVVVARSASGQASATVAISSPFGSTSSMIASTTTSQSARSRRVGGDPQPRRLGPLDLGAGGDHLLLRAPGRGLAAGEQDRLRGRGRDRGEPGGDGPEPAIPGLSYPCVSLITAGFLSRSRTMVASAPIIPIDESIDCEKRRVLRWKNGNGRLRRPRGSDRRGGPHPDRPRPPGEGLLPRRPPLDPPRPQPRSADRARRDRPARGRRRDRRLRAAVRRADLQHHPQRLAAGGAAGGGAGDHRRPPVRLRPAGGQPRPRR